MCLSYLVENFFLVILRPRIFFVYENFQKKSIFRSNFRDFTRSTKFCWQVKIKTSFETVTRFSFLNENIYRGNRCRRPNIAGKTYAISRFFAKIIPVPISPKIPNIALFLRFLSEITLWASRMTSFS
jgi:hypothetical protein